MRKTAYRGVALLLAALCLYAPIPSRAAAPAVQAGGVALLEVNTTKVLYAQNAHVKLPMASTTKVMTALLAVERGDLDALVTVPDSACGAEGSSMYLEKGEKLSLRDLLYGLMLASGNDAAIAIAVHLGGSVEGFAAMMNKRAKELGALNTNFVTPNGLHDAQHYTTAFDLALISAAALKNPAFCEICGSAYYKTTTGNAPRVLKNKNKILWQYEGGCGVKTGYTKAAGKCLVFSAERNGMTLVGVVLNCPNMFPDAMEILDYGFDAYEMYPLFSAGSVVARTPVEGGLKNVLEVTVKKDIMIPISTDVHEPSVSVRIIPDGTLTAPVEKGSAAGTLEVWEGEKLLVSQPVYAYGEVAERNVPYYLKKLIGGWTA